MFPARAYPTVRAGGKFRFVADAAAPVTGLMARGSAPARTVLS